MKLTYRDQDGAVRAVEGCELTKDKTGRHWLWSAALQQNLSYRIESREDAVIAALDSALFRIQLMDERMRALQRIVDAAQAFADIVKPDEDESED